MHRDVRYRAKLAALRNGDIIPHEELYDLIHEFGHAMFLEAEPDVVALLDHPVWQIRCIAVRVLTFHWDISRHRDKLIYLLRHDPEYEVRSFTSAGLGFVFRDSHDPVVSRALIEIIWDRAEDTSLRESAYTAVRRRWSPPSNVKQDLADMLAEIQSGKERDKAWDAARSREERHGILWMWKQEKLLKIDWEFVERIERSMQAENSGSGQSSAADPS